MRSSARKSMTSGWSSVALVVRLKSTSFCWAAARGARVGDGRLEHLEVHQRLAAEERDVRGLAGARFAQREVHARPGRLLAHELGLAAVLGVDDLVFAVLVAVGAGQVALVGHVDHQGLDGHGLERDDLEGWRLDRQVVHGADAMQLGDRVLHFGLAEARRQRRQQLGGRVRPRRQQIDDGRRALVEGKHRRARHHVAETLPRRLERVELAQSDLGHAHGVTVGSNFM